MTILLRGIDVANFTPVLHPESLAGLRQRGYSFAIPGTQTGMDGKNYANYQINGFRTAGFDVPALYVWCYWRHSAEQVELAVDFARTRLPTLSNWRAAWGPKVHIWLDCEDALPPNMTPAQVTDQIARYVQACGEIPCGIYTGGWWWPGATGNSTAFAHLPLWHAGYIMQKGKYPPSGPPMEMHGVGYGGWAKPAIWQYASEGPCDINADHDVWEIPGIQEDKMIRLNRRSAWYDNAANQTFSGSVGVNARMDFADMPAEAVAVEAEIELQDDSGDVVVYDGDEGNDTLYAFRVERPNKLDRARVNLSHDGWFHLVSPRARLAGVSIVGFYLA